MALVVESVSSVATSNADNLTITKPTGVVVGDLLVIMAMGEHDGNAGSTSKIDCTGFTKQLSPAGPPNNSNTDLNRGAVFLWRIADSTDVAASNYTITLPGTETLGIAGMFRISGWTSGNPVYASSAPLSLTNSGLSLTRPSPSLLLMLNGIKEDSQTYSFSAQSITSGGSNPTWTEVVDASISVNQTSDTRSISTVISYANDSNTSAITAYSVTQTSTGGASGTPSPISILAVICEPINATGTNALLEVQPAVFPANVLEVGGTGTNALLEVSPEMFNQNGNATTPTVWTNEAQATTEWTNETL